MSLKKSSYYLLFSIISVALTGCSTNESVEKTEVNLNAEGFTLNASQRAMANIKTGEAEFRMITETISCTGEIEVSPQGSASVSVPLGGFIVENFLVPGASVKKGQVIARVTNPEYITLQQDYLATISELRLAEQTFNRHKVLVSQNATALKNLQQSESEYMVLKGKLAALQAQLQLIGIGLKNLADGKIQSLISIKAPISGFVTAVNHAIGQFAEAREVIFEIVNLNDLHFQLRVSEQDIARVNKGQKILIRPPGAVASYRGTVSLISPKRNTDDRTFSVHGHIESVRNELKAGMYVEADILLSSDSLLAVPAESLVYRENKPFVVTEQNGAFALQSVETGTKMEEWIQIKNADAVKGKNIVTEGASRVFAAIGNAE
jgi:cobalt-zinc-cadmium efflux system membrane fusion protein